MTRFEKRKKVASLKGEMRTIVDRCDREEREMTDDERDEFEKLAKRVETLEASIRDDEAIGDDEDRDDEEDKKDDEDEEKSRSRRVSSPVPFGKGPAVHTKRHRYSILRALRHQLEGKKVDGLEGEVSKHLADKYGKEPRGFFLPTGNEPEYRDLTTSTGTGSVFVVPELPYIELLRNRMVVKDLGATFLTGMQGKFSIPRQSGAATAYWVTEGNAPTSTNQTIDQVAFVDKTIGAYTDISRKFMYQTSIDAEAFVLADLAAVMGIELDRAAINGAGSGAEPQGILGNGSVGTFTLANDSGAGANPTYADLVKFETTVAAANAERGKLAYLTSPAARGYLKTAPKIGSTFPVFMWENDNGLGEGMINGRRALASNQVPSNLTKGSGGTGLSGMLYGNWEDLVVAQWGAIDVLVNPYILSTTGAIRINTFGEFDIQLRHPQSFCVVSSVKTV